MSVVFKVNAWAVTNFVGRQGEVGTCVNDFTRPEGLNVCATVETVELAREIAASLPKSIKIQANVLNDREAGEKYGYLTLSIALKANGVNGGRNEAGIKRYRSLRKALAKHGHEITWVTPYRNSYPTEESFEAAIA